MRLYSDLAHWFHLLTDPAEYVEEAAEYVRIIRQTLPEARTLLELGSGGGNNASHMKAAFHCTLSDLSPEMLALSGAINPELEHIQGDMRSIRLGRTFDVVFIHDAISYLTTEADLRSAIETAFVHTRPGGMAIITPDTRLEAFKPGIDSGGHDGADGRGLRYLMWWREPAPGSTEYDVDFACLLREADGSVNVVHDHHVNGIFPEATWLRLLAEAGFEATIEPVNIEDEPLITDYVAFVAKRPEVG